MNVRDRLLKTIRGEKADRVPLMLDGFLFRNRAEVDALADPGKREIGHRAFEHCACFVECPSGTNRYLVTPHQCIREASRTTKDGKVTVASEIQTPKGNLQAVVVHDPASKTVWTTKYPVESLQDIEKIRSVPWELPRNVAPPDRSKLPPDFRERLVLRTAISSPFVCVAGMMPYQYFLELCSTELPLIRELTELCLDRILRILDVVLRERSIEYVWMGGCEWITPPMASPRIYKELVQEFERKIIRRIHEAGAVCHVHCHGNVRASLELVIERGADLFEPVEPPPDGDIEFAEAKQITAGRMTLGGNLEIRILENETVGVVEAAVRKAFAGRRERMVLKATEQPLKPMSPSTVRNYHRVLDLWEELSPL